MNAECLIVDNISVVSDFLHRLVDISSPEIIEKPITHAYFNLVQGQDILFIQKNSCTSEQLSFLKPLSHRYIVVSTKSLEMIEKRVLSLNEKLIESNFDDLRIVEGPEKILIFVTTKEKIHQKSWFYEYIMFSLSIQSNNDNQTKQEIIPLNLKRNLNLPPSIPTLEAAILTENGKRHVPFLPNSREPVPFETESFKGHAMLVVRTDPIDPLFREFFEGKRRRFEVQVQGKFKRQPIGEIYVGAECANKMQLGLITRSISKAACNFCSTLVSNLHYSFGDDQNPVTNPNYQIPHITSPLFQTFDKVIVTPPDKTPPKIGVPFVEDLEFRKQRIEWASIKDAKIDLDNIYSFSVNTSNIDLVSWTLMNIPMVRPMDIRNFIGESSFSLVGYEIPNSNTQSPPAVHAKLKLNYMFSIRLKSLNVDKVVELALDPPGPVSIIDDREGDIESDNRDTRDGVASVNNSRARMAELSVLDRKQSYDTEGDEDGDGEMEDYDMVDDGEVILADDGDDDQQLPTGSPSSIAIKGKQRRFKAHNSDKGAGAVGWIRRRIDDITPDALDIPETSELQAVDYDMESMLDLRYCPMVLDIIDHRLMKNRRRRTIYLLPWVPSSMFSSIPPTTVQLHLDITIEQPNKLVPRFRSYSELSKFLPMIPIPKLHKNKKMSSEEKKRRQIIESYKSVVLKGFLGHPQVETNLNQESAIDNKFLDSSQAPVKIVKKKVAPGGTVISELEQKWEGTVCMAGSSRHWSEHVLRFTKTSITILNSSESKIFSTIPTSSIITIRPMKKTESPLFFLNTFGFFQIDTFARVYYFMVRDEWLNAWMQFLLSTYGKIVQPKLDVPIEIVYKFPEPSEVYTTRPPSWRLDKKRVFNYRKILFHSKSIDAKYQTMMLCDMIEEFLRSGLNLAEAELNGTVQPQQWISFYDQIAVLQVVNITKLNEREKMALLLNLYHLMVVHVSLILGPPLSWASWQGFFSSSYLFGFDVASIADVEYNMLRAGMSKPAPILSKITVPNAHFPGCAITQRDFRLNFCINCGSLSSPSRIPIYQPKILDRQMDQYTALMLAEFVRVDFQKKIIILPKACSSFQSDFIPRKIHHTTQLDCLRTLLPYFRLEERQVLVRNLTDGVTFNVRYGTYDFRCRQLSLLL